MNRLFCRLMTVSGFTITRRFWCACNWLKWKDYCWEKDKLYHMIVDYSRRTDPACEAGLKLFQKYLYPRKLPKVVSFWTKAPAVLAKLYASTIQELQEEGTVVCAHITLNYYESPLEAVTNEMRELGPLVDLLGCQAVRLRFDPIIFGYTTLSHYRQVLETAEQHNVSRITINFMIPEYEGVGMLLSKHGIVAQQGTLKRKISTLQRLRDETPEKVEIAVCAETAQLCQYVPGIIKASCADTVWFERLGLTDKVSGHASRKGCGCFYTADWGKYPNKGGYVCPHKCLYCYAKHNVYSYQKNRQKKLFITNDGAASSRLR